MKCLRSYRMDNLEKISKSKNIYFTKMAKEMVIDILIKSNSSKAKIRKLFRELEIDFAFYYMRDYISLMKKDCEDRGKHNSKLKLLIAGSGLGNEIFNYASREKLLQIFAVEKNEQLYNISKNYLNAFDEYLKNLEYESIGERVTIHDEDFFALTFDDNTFDFSLLNSGTIGNFYDDEKIKLLQELNRVTNHGIIIDFYSTEKNVIKNISSMYKEEGLEHEIKGTTIQFTKPEGAFSEGMDLSTFDALVTKALGKDTHRMYKRMPDFGWMSCIMPTNYKF